MSKSDDRELLLAQAAALQELEARQQECPIATYSPHPKQKEFSESTAPIAVMLAGNRMGKTHANVAETIAGALGYRPWLVPNFKLEKGPDGKWQFPPRNDVPSAAWVRRLDGLPIAVPNKVVAVTGLSLARGIGEVIQSKWNELWPRQVEIKVYLGPLGVWQKIRLPNGSEVYFGSATQANLAWEGFSSSLVVADEPIPRRVFTALRRGLIDNQGQFRYSLTPLGDANIAWIAADLLRDERHDVHVIRGSSFDNPYQARESLEAFFNDPSMSQEEKEARMTGKVAALGRRIVTTFGDQNIIPTTDIPLEVPRVMVVDPHHSRPPFIIWAAVFDPDDIVIYREFPTGDFYKKGVPSISVDELAGEIKRLEGRERIYWRIADPSFSRQKAKVLGEQFLSFEDRMAEHDLVVDTCVDNDVDRGIQELRDAFKVNETIGRSRVRVMRHCANTIRSLSFWAYEGMTDEGVLKVSEQFKDGCDACRYLVMYDGLVKPSESGGFNYLEDVE